MSVEIMRMAQDGIPVDQISAMTGQPPEMINAILSGGNRGVGISGTNIMDPLAQYGSPELINKISTNMMDQGLDDADATDMLGGAVSAGVVANENSVEQTQENSQSNVDAIRTASDIYGLNPQNNTETNKIYMDALSDYLDTSTEDIKKLVPEPDKALPYLVAGAAMINSGEKGDSWGSALSNAFLQYAVGSNKEKKEYRNALASIDMNKAKAMQGLASSLFLEDAKLQKSLGQKMISADAQLYEVSVDGVRLDRPVAYRDFELITYRNNPQLGVDILGKWTEDKGTLKNYTVTDKNDKRIVIGLTEAQVKRYQEEGTYKDIQVGDQLAGAKFFHIDGQDVLTTTEDAMAQRDAGADVSKTASMMEAFDTTTNVNTWVSPATIKAQNKAGTTRYIPLSNSIAFSMDSNGNPTLAYGHESFIQGAAGEKANREELKQFNEKYQAAAFNRDRILSTIDTLRDIHSYAENQGSDILFGLAGDGVKFGRSVLTTANQLGELFSKGNNFNFYESKTADGEIVQGTSVKMNQGNFKNMIYDSPEFQEAMSSGMGQYLIESGLNKVEAENLIFRLALSSAMLEGQKGRDISDRDIILWLRQAGEGANDKREFFRIIDNLEYYAVDYVDKLEQQVSRSPYRKANPDGPGTIGVLEDAYGRENGIFAKDKTYIPTPGNRIDGNPYESIEERRVRLRDRRGPGRTATGSTGEQFVVPESGMAPSGVGNTTVDGLMREVLRSSVPLGRMANLRQNNRQSYELLRKYILELKDKDPDVMKLLGAQ